jgi:transposase
VCGIAACIPSTRSRKQPIPYDTAFYRQRHRNEAIFGKLKDWRRIATRYDKTARNFLAGICLAAAISWCIS